MSKYTTGEIAKLCEVSIRTVQYYDTRGILVPSELSEGGRRIYSEEDLKRMKIICFLRNLDLPIDSVKELLAEEHPENVISILLDEQEKALRMEIEEKQSKVNKMEEVRRILTDVEHFSVESIADVAYIMENKKKLRKVYGVVIAVGILMEIVEAGLLVWWYQTGHWQPFAIGMCLTFAMGLGVCRWFLEKASYICPQCHEVFKPKYWEFVFAKHTPNTRKLTCTDCGYHGYCVETYGREKKENE